MLVIHSMASGDLVRNSNNCNVMILIVFYLLVIDTNYII